MPQKIRLHDNFEVNFTLKGFTSIQIGIYFFLLGYAYKYILESFLIEGHAIGFLSPEIIEIIFISITATFASLSSLALFFSGKRIAKKFQLLLWNGKTKTIFLKYLIGIIVFSYLLILLMRQGFIDFMMPAFSIIYALFLFLVKNKARKNLLILSCLSLLLGVLCFVIPSYWYAAFTILAIAHITYGLVTQ